MRGGGIVKNKKAIKNNPSVTCGDSSLYTREPLELMLFRMICSARCARCLQRCNTKAQLAIKVYSEGII